MAWHNITNLGNGANRWPTSIFSCKATRWLNVTKGNRIIFIEVKTRSDLKVDPVQSINSRKIGRICAAANSYVKQHKLPHEVQFDIVIVIGNPDSYTIEHIPDAFIAPMRGYR